MPRQPRRKSESGIYHIMMRGINKQAIFQDDEDYEKFLDVLKVCKDSGSFAVYAYCLMDNHIHILLKEKSESVSTAVKRISDRFVKWYNSKYQRKGHLFQERFKSEPVEDDSYFYAIMRYIHQNPLKAELCDKIEEYPYTSYREYIDDKPYICSCSAVYKLISKEDLIKYNNLENDDIFLEEKFINDAEALKMIKDVSGCCTVAEFQKMSNREQTECVARLKGRGLTVKQISRLTGLSISIVRYS